ncbi:MAG: FtsW/RodA/SpoVE family cell cycle protein, partial [Actinomycetota bacterium]
MTAIRRNTEASLLLLASLVAASGYALALLGRKSSLHVEQFAHVAAFGLIFLIGHVAVRKLAPAADPLFVPLASILSALGFVLISRLDLDLATAQLRWLAVAVGSMILVLYLVKDLRALARYRYTFAIAGLFLLLLPMVPGLGREINGSRLWIRLGALSFQPAELGKICLVLFFAGYLSERRELLAVATRRIGPIGVPEFRHFGPVLLAWAV